MAWWSKKPDLAALERSGEAWALFHSLTDARPETRTRIVEALIRIMTREGHTSSSRHNVEAAEVLLSLGHWEALLAFYDQYQRSEDTPSATGCFVLDLIRLLSERAVQDRNFPLMKHLMLTAFFGFEALGSHPLVGGSPQLKAFGDAMVSAGRAQDLVEVRMKAVDPLARNAAAQALTRVAPGAGVAEAVASSGLWEETIDDFLTKPRWVVGPLDDPILEGLVKSGHAQAGGLIRLIAEKGVLEALSESNRGELLKRYQERPTRRVDPDQDRRIQKYFRRLLQHTRTTQAQAVPEG